MLERINKELLVLEKITNPSHLESGFFFNSNTTIINKLYD